MVRNLRVVLILVAFIVVSVSHAERGRSKGPKENKEGQTGTGRTIKEKIRESGAAAEQKESTLQEYKAREEYRKNLGEAQESGSTSKGGTTSGLRSPVKDIDTKSVKDSAGASHEGETEGLSFRPSGVKEGAKAAEAVGRGEREEATGKELTAAEKELVAKAAKQETEELAATGKGKDQKAKIDSIEKYETAKRFFKPDPISGKVKAVESKPGVNDFVERMASLASPRTESLELALKVLAEKMVEEGKSVEELEAAIKDFIEYWNKEVKGKLPEELQRNALAYVLASKHRGPMEIAKLKSTLAELLKEENPETVLKGLVMSETSYGEIFLKSLRNGLSIAEAHEKALANKAQFLKERGLTAEEISQLPKCEVTGLLGLSRFLLRSGH